MIKLNKHDKETVINCIKSNLEEKIVENQNILKNQKRLILKSEMAKTFKIIRNNYNLKKDIKNLEKAIYPQDNLKPD